MPACAGTHRDDAVDALLDRFLGVPEVDDIVKHDAAIAVDCVDDFGRGPEARDDDRHFVPDAGLHVGEQALVAHVADLIYRVRCYRFAGMGFCILGELGPDPGEPLVEHCLRPCVQRGE